MTTTLTRIGSFPNAVQIVPTQEQVHDLLSDPLKPGFAGGGDLIYHGGQTIKGGRVFNVYLGTPSFDTVDFDNFTRALCATYYLSPDQTDKSPSTFAGSVTIPNPFPAVVQDTVIKRWLDEHVGSLINPGHATPDTYYALIFPPGTTVFMGQDSSCANFCGFHERTSGGIWFGVMDDTLCSGCHGSFTPSQARMMVHAHEYAEWRSDPNGDAWYDNMGWENADKCAWQGVQWGPYFVQPFWVNGKGAYYGPYVAPQPVPQPPPPVPNPPPPPPPPSPPPQPTGTVVMTFSAFDSAKTYQMPTWVLPKDAGVIRGALGRFTYTATGKTQPFGITFSQPRTPIGKMLKWIGERL